MVTGVVSRKEQDRTITIKLEKKVGSASEAPLKAGVSYKGCPTT